MNRWLEYPRLLLECLSYVVVIVGIGLFFVQQETARRAQQVEMAMRFVQLESESTFAEAREALEAPWRTVNMSQVAPTEDGRAKLKATVTESVGDEKIEQLTEFYLSVLDCRSAEICDAKVIDRFFRSDISGFYCLYDVRLASIAERLNRPTYADPLRDYATCN